MAKKNSSSEKSTRVSDRPVPERRRTPRATTRSTASTPDAIVAEPDGTPAVARHTANEMPRHGDGSITNSSPSYEEIAEAAYHRYLRRGGQHGYDFDDWIDAERSLRARG
jgi:hypothetical protein